MEREEPCPNPALVAKHLPHKLPVQGCTHQEDGGGTLSWEEEGLELGWRR